MNLTREQNKDFERKLLQLAEFAQSIGLTITNKRPQNHKAPIRETSPEEVKISGVRNLIGGEIVENEYECKVIYLQK